MEEERPEEVFRRSNQGRELPGYDLDSPKEFKRWDHDQNSYHCYDIVYVQIHLYPQHDRENGCWHFELSFDLGHYANVGFRIAFALEKAGIPFTIGQTEEKLSALMGEDIIYFSPDAQDFQLPYPGERRISMERIEKAIGLIDWKKFEEINTIVTSHSQTKVLFYPCDDEHYPKDDEDDCCLIR